MIDRAEKQASVRPDSFTNDSVMLDYIQQVHLNYMWDGAEPNSGLAPERIHLDGVYPENDAHIVTTGGSGFGVAGLLVGIDRGFIDRKEGVKRLQQAVNFLTKADRFHGVWSHWIDGRTGKTKPFGPKDDGVIWLRVRSLWPVCCVCDNILLMATMMSNVLQPT